jgi:hypothetical protein
MKSLMILGGIIGFATGLLFSWAQKGAWPASLWHACLAAYLAGMLMRWWGNAWRKSLAASLNERQTFSSQPSSSPTSKAIKS